MARQFHRAFHPLLMLLAAVACLSAGCNKAKPVGPGTMAPAAPGENAGVQEVGSKLLGAGGGPAPVGGQNIYAVFETDLGPFVVKLFEDKAPRLVKNFVELAEGTQQWRDPETGDWVRRPFYDGLAFHRVVRDYLIQSGDPQWMVPEKLNKGNPGYMMEGEFPPDLKHDRPGLMGMATLGSRDSVGSQFYITLAPAELADGHSPIVGEVVAGMEAVEAINKVAVEDTVNWKPVAPVYLPQSSDCQGFESAPDSRRPT